MIEKILEQVDATLHGMRLPYQLNWVSEDKFGTRLEVVQSYGQNAWLGNLAPGLKQLSKDIVRNEGADIYVLELGLYHQEVQKAKKELEQSLRDLEAYVSTIPESSGVVYARTRAEVKGDSFFDTYLVEKSQDLTTRIRDLRLTLTEDGARNVSKEQLTQEFLGIAQDLSTVNQYLAENYPTGMRKELTNTWDGVVDLMGKTIERIYFQENPGSFMAYGNSYGMTTVVVSNNKKSAEAQVA